MPKRQDNIMLTKKDVNIGDWVTYKSDLNVHISKIIKKNDEGIVWRGAYTQNGNGDPWKVEWEYLIPDLNNSKITLVPAKGAEVKLIKFVFEEL